MAKTEEQLRDRIIEIEKYLYRKDSEMRNFVLRETDLVGDAAVQEIRRLMKEKVYALIGEMAFPPEKREDWLDFCNNSEHIIANFLFVLESYRNNEDMIFVRKYADDHRGYISAAMDYFVGDWGNSASDDDFNETEI